MKIKCLGMCRGEGKGYAKLQVSGTFCGEDIRVEAQAVSGQSIPVAWYEEQEASSAHTRLGVLVFPLLKTESYHFKFFFGDLTTQSTTFDISAKSLIWRSRFNYKFRKALCERLRSVDVADGTPFKMELATYMPDEDEAVWRLTLKQIINKKEHAVKSKNPNLAAQSFRFSVLDTSGGSLDISPIFFEDRIVAVKESATSELDGALENEAYERLLTVSFRLPISLDEFCIAASDPASNQQALYCVEPATVAAIAEHSCRVIKDAGFDDDYQRWHKFHSVTLDELAKQRSHRFSSMPLISVVVPIYRPNLHFLRAMIDSVFAQSYTLWELILVDSECAQSGVSTVLHDYDDERLCHIEVADNKGIVGNTNIGIQEAQGDYIGFLDYDDLLEPNALFEYTQAINNNPQAGAFYCDEDVFEREGVYFAPVFKTAFNRDLLYVHNCVTHFLMVRKSVLDEIGLSDDEVSGAQDYDLTLRVSETDYAIIHVPKVLYHWRLHAGSTSGDNATSKPYAHEAGRLALEQHFTRREIKVNVEDGDRAFVYQVKYTLPTPQPLVDIVIPSKDHIDILDRCITSIFEKSTYTNYRITIVENNSEDDQTFAYYRQLQAEHHNVNVVNWEHDFNYPKLINFGAANTSGDYLLFLNNDTEVITPDFIEEMLGYLQRPEVGVVGAKLLFHDRLVQHAGMLIGPYDVGVHVNQNVAPHWGGYLCRATRPGNFSSVTGACQMTRRKTFDEVGGYTEAFAIGFNDMDFCCKLNAAGYLVVFTPYALLYHYEFISRGREEGDSAKMKRWKEEHSLMMKTWPAYFEQGDPFTNPNLERNNNYFALPETDFLRHPESHQEGGNEE